MSIKLKLAVTCLAMPFSLLLTMSARPPSAAAEAGVRAIAGPQRLQAPLPQPMGGGGQIGRPPGQPAAHGTGPAVASEPVPPAVNGRIRLRAAGGAGAETGDKVVPGRIYARGAYEPKHFGPDEFGEGVNRDLAVNTQLLMLLDSIRSYFKEPITVGKAKTPLRGVQQSRDLHLQDLQHQLGNAVRFRVRGVPDKTVIDELRKNADKFPFLRGLDVRPGADGVYVDVSNVLAKGPLLYGAGAEGGQQQQVPKGKGTITVVTSSGRVIDVKPPGQLGANGGYIPAYLGPEEVVDGKVLQAVGPAKVWQLFRPQLLIGVDMARAHLGSITVNTWARGGQFSQRGYRDRGSPYFSDNSQHSLGNAMDADFFGISPDDVRRKIVNNPDTAPFITALEGGVNWVHMDARNHLGDPIFVFNP